MSLTKNDSMAAMASLLGYGAGDSDPESDDESKTAQGSGLVSYGGDEEKPSAGLMWEKQEADMISDDDIPQVEGLAKVVDDTYINAFFNSESAVALSESIRRSFSTDESDVRLPPEPQGRCSRHLQEKIANYYKKRFDLNNIQKRKDFRNPSIYDKLISFLRIDELGSNYPTDVFDPHGWEEVSYYEALAKAQKEDMAKREKEKKERTKVEFKMGMVKKTLPAPAVATITAATAAPAATSSTAVSTQPASAIQPLLSITTSHALPTTSSEEPERKRKSKWGVVPSDTIRPLLPLPTPLQPYPMAMLPRPQVNIISASIANPTGLAPIMPNVSAVKTTVIPSVGVLKKPKMDK